MQHQVIGFIAGTALIYCAVRAESLNILQVKLGLQNVYADGHAWARRCKFPYNVLHFETFVGSCLIRNETAAKG